MNKADLKRLAKRTQVAPELLERWHGEHGPKFGTTVKGKPSQRVVRPMGTLTVAEIVKKYEIAVQTLARWRDRGLAYQRIGKVIAIRESDLKAWIQKYGIDS